MCTKKILAFTSIRSDYDLMSMIYKKLNEEDGFEIKLIVAGAHLSETYGYTYDFIKDDGIPVLAEIENLIDSSSQSARLKSLSILLQDCIHSIVKYNPDAIMYAGDREDVIIGGIIGTYLRIPTIHFFGGDHAIDGNVDNQIRHATSKLSSIHFVSNKYAKKRLMMMGEDERRIFNVGSPSLDKFTSTPIMTKEEELGNLNKSEWDEYALLIFHPNTDEEEMAGEYFREILTALEMKNIKAFVSYPNVDGGNKKIINVINEFSKNGNFSFYKNLDRTTFVNLLRNATFMIGNSSAGLYEAPTLKLGVVNVGNRQRGRLASENVIFVDQGINNILDGIEKVLSNDFKENLKVVESFYGDGHSVDKVVEILKSNDFSKYITKTEDPLDREI